MFVTDVKLYFNIKNVAFQRDCSVILILYPGIYLACINDKRWQLILLFSVK